MACSAPETTATRKHCAPALATHRQFSRDSGDGDAAFPSDFFTSTPDPTHQSVRFRGQSILYLAAIPRVMYSGYGVHGSALPLV